MVCITSAVIATVIAHSRAAAPEEGCGLLAADRSDAIVHAYPLPNMDRSPVRFTVDPDGHFAALGHSEVQGWKLAGVFHSHPRSAARPSRTDVAGALERDWVHLIVGLHTEPPEVRAWRIRDGAAVEEAVEVVAG